MVDPIASTGPCSRPWAPRPGDDFLSQEARFELLLQRAHRMYPLSVQKRVWGKSWTYRVLPQCVSNLWQYPYTNTIPHPTSHHHWGAPLPLRCCTTIGAPYYRLGPNEYWAPYFRVLTTSASTFGSHRMMSTSATPGHTTQLLQWPSVAEGLI